MQVMAPGREELRRLTELRLERPVVLSLYLDLDPTEFATPPARATAVRSLLDEADRRVRDHRELSHQDRADLETSLEWARSLLERDLRAEGAHAMALFASRSADLFEAMKLPRSVRNRVEIGRSPLVGPLAVRGMECGSPLDHRVRLPPGAGIDPTRRVGRSRFAAVPARFAVS